MQRKSSDNNNLSPPPPAKVARVEESQGEITKILTNLSISLPRITGHVVVSHVSYVHAINNILCIMYGRPNQKCGCAYLHRSKTLILAKYPVIIVVSDAAVYYPSMFHIKFSAPPSAVVSDMCPKASDPETVDGFFNELVKNLASGPSSGLFRAYLLDIYYRVSNREYGSSNIRKNKETMARKLADEFPKMFMEKRESIDSGTIRTSIRNEFDKHRVNALKYINSIRKNDLADPDLIKLRTIIESARAHKEAFDAVFHFPGLDKESAKTFGTGIYAVLDSKYNYKGQWTPWTNLPYGADTLSDDEYYDKIIENFSNTAIQSIKFLTAGIKKLTSDELYKLGLQLSWENEEALWKECLDKIKTYLNMTEPLPTQ